MSAPSMRFKKAYVEITNLCNLECAFCPGTRRPPRMMSASEFRQAAKALRPYTGYLYFHLMGEPLLHDDLPELLDICAELGFKVNLTTNGTLIGALRDALLSAPALRKVGFSLHSFEANKGTQSLEEYLGAILSFSEAARERGILCELRLWNTDSASRGGANALNGRILRYLEGTLGFAEGSLPESAERGRLANRLYLAMAEIFDWPDGSREDEQARLFCYGLRDQIGVLADGTVVPCCLDSEGTIALGNLFAEPLAPILESSRARAVYDGFSRREAAEPLCRKCGYARRF